MIKKLEKHSSPFVGARLSNYDYSCSGTWISNDGHLLTALHCIENCLLNDSAVTEESIEGTFFSIRKIDQRKVKDVVCDIPKTGLQWKVVAVGAKGWIPDYQRDDLRADHPELFDDLIAKGFDGIGGAGDFAILKVEKSKDEITPLPYFTYPPRCLPLAKEVKANTEVWSFSFPAVTRRKNLYGLYSPLASGGKIINEDEHPLVPKSFLRKLLGNDTETIISSTDAEGGASGSALVNKNGEIVAEVHTRFGLDTDFVEGTTLAIPVDKLLARVRKDYGQEMVNTLTSSCEVHPETKLFIESLTKVSTKSMFDDDYLEQGYGAQQKHCVFSDPGPLVIILEVTP